MLHSSREQVRHLFGKPGTAYLENVDSFHDDIGVISFSYSTGTCSLKNLDNWNIPEGTVQRINIFFPDGLDASLFGADVADSIKGSKYQTFFKSYENYKIEFRAESNKILIAKILPLENNSQLMCKE